MTTPTCSDLADITWLTGSEAGAVLADLADDAAPLHSTTARLRKCFSPARTHMLLEQLELRRRAAAKFTRPQTMFFTRVGLEQATDEWVATCKANSLKDRAEPCRELSIADLCCGVGGDLMAISRRATAIGIDREPIAALFASINSGAPVQSIDIANLDVASFHAWHIDPDRRSAGRRTTSLEYCAPSRTTIEQLLARSPNAAIKLAPATRPPPEWLTDGEFEWISRDGECKQMVAWHGNLATQPGQHRATVVSSAGDSVPQTFAGAPNLPLTVRSRPDRYIFDVDPAVVAARLIGALAMRHDLSAVSAGPTYLTGPHANGDAALTCFEVQEILPLDTRKLAQHFRALAIGELEIKKRGLDLDPQKLRRDLKLRGPNAATVLITPIDGRPSVIRARRVSPPPTL